MEALKKIQHLPEFQRKLIFWIILIIIGSVAFYFWLWKAKRTLKGFSEKSFFEKINLPNYEVKALEELKEGIEELEKVQGSIQELETQETLPQELEALIGK